MKKIRYRPEIDGLRAIAILTVLAFHFDLGIEGGFVGVDIFFVISGYLITTQIHENLIAGSFSLIDFYQRRLKRLLPAAVVMMIITTAAGHFLLVPSDYREFGQSLLAQAFFSANFYFFRESDYFVHGGVSRPLLHCWSLAVEEQFYFLFPALLVGLFKLKRASAWLVLIFLTGLSMLASIHYTDHSPLGAFYLLPTRGWELLIGGVVALSERRVVGAITGPLKSGLAFAGVALTLGPVVLFTSHTPFPGYVAGLPCIGTAALIVSTSVRSSYIGKILSCSPLVSIGMISYSLYLWHWPIIEFSKIFELS